jgi:hypothetical protein
MTRAFTIRLALVAAMLTVASAAAAEQRIAIISVAGCASINGPNKGYALLNAFYEMANGVENDGTASAMVLCDAELPPDASTFDFAEFEYTSGGPGLYPWLVVLQVWRMPAPGGGIESWIQEVGQCGQEPPVGDIFDPYLPTSPPTSPMNICQTAGDLDLTAITAAAPDVEASLVYLVVLPGWSSSTDDFPDGWAQAFRIVQYYEQ